MSSTKGSAIVTGSARGIGKGIALRLALDGYDVALFDIPQYNASLEEVASTIVKDTGRKSIVVTGDVTIEKDIVGLVEQTVQAFGGLDVVRSTWHFGLKSIFFCLIISLLDGRERRNTLSRRNNRAYENPDLLAFYQANTGNTFSERGEVRQDVSCEREGNYVLLQACCESNDQAGAWRKNSWRCLYCK